MAYLIIILLAAMVLSAFAIFTQRRVLYAVLALTSVFTISALLFLYLGQTLLALLQLLVFVGGLSTYLIVALATEKHEWVAARLPYLAILSLFLFIALMTLLIYYPAQPSQSGGNAEALLAAMFTDYYAFLFAVVILLFAGTIGSVLIAKKFTRLVV